MIGILTVSHGTGDSRGQRAMTTFAQAIHARVEADHYAHAHVDVQEPSLPTALVEFPDECFVVVVPLLLSRGFHLEHDIPTAVAASGRTVRVSGALGPDERLARVLHRRLVAQGVRESDRVILAAAGSTDHRGIEDAEQAARLLARYGNYPVTTSYLSAARPSLSEALISARDDSTVGSRMVVASYLLAPGYFSDRVCASGADVVTDPLLMPDGAPDEDLVALAVERYRSCVPPEFSADRIQGV